MDVFEERPHGVAARPRSRAPILAFLVTGHLAALCLAMS